MKRIFLYYPTIDFPDKNWLYQALFYADSVGSLVPFESMKDKNWKISDELSYLYDQEEYVPYFVNEFIQRHPEKYDECIQAYKRFARSKEYKRLQKSSEMMRLGLSHNPSLFHLGYFRLSSSILYDAEGAFDVETEGPVDRHDARFEYAKYELRHILDPTNYVNQLTKKHKIRGVFIEKLAGLYYMFALAQFVGGVDTNLVTLSTNNSLYEQLAFFTSGLDAPGMRILLDKCLPTPNVHIPIKKIIQFKKKRKPELLQLRKKLQELQSKIGAANSQDEIKEIIIDFKESVAIELSTVKRVLIEERISFAFESMSSLLRLDHPALLSAMLAGGIIATQINPALGIGIGAIGVLGEIITRYKIKDKANQARELAYLFSARKEGLINWP